MMLKIYKSKGQSLIEFIIIMPLFFVILFGIFELAYIYRAKSTFNTATFEAARQGSLEHARLGAMRSALRSGMLAEFIHGDKSISGMGSAVLRTLAFESAMNKISPVIEVTSPTKEIFNSFKVKRMVKLIGQKKEKLQYILPNDNLNLRTTVAKNITIDSKKRKITIQDANLLKIKSYWCYEMKVPIIKNLIYDIVSVSPSSEQLACNKLTLISGLFSSAKYLALSSQAIVRMQSPVIIDGNNLK